MGIKDFKEKLSNIDFKTGAKRVVAGVCIASALCLPLAQTAHAAVPASNIVADQQYGYSRQYVKTQDGKDINARFCAFDYYGNAKVDTDDIRKAIELSNVLNSYYFDEYYYTNTNKNEVLNLNVDSLYDSYQYASYQPQWQPNNGCYPQNQCPPEWIQPNNGCNHVPNYQPCGHQHWEVQPQYQPQCYYVNPVEEFCKNNMGQKPAVDAYITFSCGTVANGLKDRIADEISCTLKDEGYRITKNPVITVHNCKLYAVVGLNNATRVIEIKGENVQYIVDTLCAVDHSYNLALNNLTGKSNQYESSFAYNGVDRYTGESVWLSLPDDAKKANLTAGVELYEKLSDNRNLSISCSVPRYPSSTDYNERQLLKNLGYTDYQARNAKAFDATLTVYNYCYTHRCN